MLVHPLIRGIKSLILETKCQFKHQDLHMFHLKLNNYYQLEFVGRGSETQFQVGENLNKLP